MIQTHLLKAEPPYQIISAAGQVGIQVATLIVTEDKSTEEGYQIDTHSHPVVNYGLKTLAENQEDEGYIRFYSAVSPLRPEGAVWNQVEISDVQVLGLAGITREISMDDFCMLVPPARLYVGEQTGLIWDRHSVYIIQSLRWGLRRVGVTPKRYNTKDFSKDKENRIIVELSARRSATMPPMVKVRIPPHGKRYLGISFMIPLFDDDYPEDVGQCAGIIKETLLSLFIYFVDDPSIVVRQDSGNVEYREQLQKIADRVNEHLAMHF